MSQTVRETERKKDGESTEERRGGGWEKEMKKVETRVAVERGKSSE